MKDNNKKAMLNYIAILAIYLFSGTGRWENAAIETMAQAWLAVDITLIRMLGTIPFLVSMPIMLVIGGLVGKKISYRACVNIGSLLIIIGGAAPYIYAPSWTAVLIFRGLLGAGVGFYAVRNAALVKSVPYEKQARYIGLGTAMMNICNTVMQTLAGALTKAGWNAPFLVNAFAIIPAVYIFLCFKEPVEDEPLLSEKEDENLLKNEKMDYHGWVYAVIQFFSTLSLYPLLSGMSTFLASRNIGSATIAGTVLSVYTLTGFVVNLFLPNVKKIFGKSTPMIMCALVAVGQAIVLFVPNIVATYLGTILCVFGFMANFSLFYIYLGQSVPASKVGFASSLILALNQLSVFLSRYFIVGCHAVFGRATDVESSFIGCIIVYAALALIFAFGKLVPEEK